MSTIYPTSFSREIDLETASTQLGLIDENSLLRIGNNIEVNNFNDMKEIFSFALDRTNLTFGTRCGFIFSNELNNFIMPPLYPFKPEATLVSGTISAPFRLAITTLASEEAVKTSEALIVARLKEILDSYEAFLLHQFLFSASVLVSTGLSHRSRYAGLTAFMLAREPATKNIYFSVPTVSLHTTLYAHASRTNDNIIYPTADQWFQTDEFLNVNRKMVKVVADFNSILASRFYMVAYGDFVLKTFRRYFFDKVFVERAKETAQEQNRYRVVLDRYVLFTVPAVRYNIVSPTGSLYTTSCVSTDSLSGVLEDYPYLVALGTILSNHLRAL